MRIQSEIFFYQMCCLNSTIVQQNIQNHFISISLLCCSNVGVFVFSYCQFFNLIDAKRKISLRCLFFITLVGMIPSTILLPVPGSTISI